MRTNANQKVHKPRRDPYKMMLRTAGILAAIVVVGLGVFFGCRYLIESEYLTAVSQVEQQNAQGKIEFDKTMDTLRNNRAAQLDPDTGEITVRELGSWVKEIDGATWRIAEEAAAAPENTRMITVERNALLTGGMMLVNAWHALPDVYFTSQVENELVSVGNASNWKIPARNANVRVYPVAFDALAAALADATAKELKHFTAWEGYRTNDDQSALFTARAEKLSSKYSGDTLIQETKKYVNYPGTSEYQTGMSFILRLYDSKDAAVNNLVFQESEQGKWFTGNSWRYGLVFRFPTKDYPNSAWEDKSYKTGISTEMNLYRYVGKAHAAAMTVMGYCLEEYVEFLIDHPHFSIYEGDKLLYEIYRIPSDMARESYDLIVPNPASDYQASFDNMGGIVMAYAYN